MNWREGITEGESTLWPAADWSRDDHSQDVQRLREDNLELTRRNGELEELVFALNQALQRSEAFAQLTMGNVHDFRNALAAIQGEACFLRECVQVPEQLESVKAIELASMQASNLARDMLSHVRRTDPPGGLVNSRELAVRCQPLIVRVVKDGIRCVFEFDPEAWPVRVEAHQLEAALLNLGANARDAMPEGGELHVRVRNKPQLSAPGQGNSGDFVSFSFEDNGCGMPPEVLARATEPFFTTKEGERGTGLGLAMVQAFVRAARGQMNITSQVGHGTTVEILIPRAVGPEPNTSTGPQAALIAELEGQVRTAWLRHVLLAWSSAWSETSLPRPARVEAALVGHLTDCIELSVARCDEGEPVFQLVRIGQNLRNRLEPLAASSSIPMGELLSAFANSYRRAFETGLPMYEYARYSFGQGEPFEFERLILPAGAGLTVSHLYGVVLFSNAEQGGIEDVQLGQAR